jgi:hypothetical protein
LTIDWNFNWNLDPYNNPPPPAQTQPTGGYDWNWDWNLDPYNNPAPQPANVYTPAPAPAANPWDFNGNQQPPAYQQQTPFQVPTPADPFSVVNQFTNNAFQSASDSDAFTRTLNAFADPWQAPDKQGMAPWEWLGGNVNRVAESVLGGTGTAIGSAGGLVNDVARSDIPVVSQAAQLGQGVFQNVIEPIGNFPTAIYGALSQNGDPFDLLHGAGPAGYVVGGAADLLQGRDPTQYYKDVAGKLPQTELAKMAFQPGYYDQVTKEQSTRNPFTIAEEPGLEAYRKLPAAVQLPLAFSETLNPGNLAYNAALRPVIRGAGKVAGAAADVTGASKAFDALDKKLESPQQYNATIARENYFAQQVLGDAEAQLGSPDLARSAVFEQPDSPFYWEKQGIHPEVAQGAQYFLEAERQANAPVDNAMQPGETKIPQSESDFARQLQDTNPTPAPAPKADPFSLPTDPTWCRLNRLEQFGVPGKIINALGFTMPFMTGLSSTLRAGGARYHRQPGKSTRLRTSALTAPPTPALKELPARRQPPRSAGLRLRRKWAKKVRARITSLPPPSTTSSIPLTNSVRTSHGQLPEASTRTGTT